MIIKKPSRIYSAFLTISISLSAGSDGFCQNFTQQNGLNGFSNIKYNLEPNKIQNAHTESLKKNDDSTQDNPTPDPEISDSQKKYYKSMRNKIRTLEIVYQTLNAFDAIQTISCMQKTNCQEQNPLFGKRPSTAKIIAIKSLSGLLHYAAYKHGTKYNDRLKYTMTMEIITIGVQGAVVGLNFRAAF